MEHSAFTAEYVNLRPVPSRNVVQVILEVPMEKGDSIVKMLGMPNPGASKWVGVAMLQPNEAKKDVSAGQGLAKVAEPAEQAAAGVVIEAPPPAVPAERRSWHSMSYAQRAGIRCGEATFWKFLKKDYEPIWRARAVSGQNLTHAEVAADVVRRVCGVTSRREIDTKPTAQENFNIIEQQYSLWLRYEHQGDEHGKA